MMKMPAKTAVTVTFADRGENEAGMQIEGTTTRRTTSVADLLKLKAANPTFDCYPLQVDNPNIESEPAALLVMRGFVSPDEADKLEHEVEAMKAAGCVDTQTLGYGQVRNKRARWNNVISWRRQEPDIAKGKGTIVSFEDWAAFRAVHDRLHEVLEQPAGQKLVGEMNYYFDVDSCGIGFHGDRERNLVAGLSLGEATAKQALKFVPFQECKALQDPIEIKLNRGDVYIMSHKAIGNDAAKRKIVTWRHARGASTCTYSELKKKQLPPQPAPPPPPPEKKRKSPWK